MDELWKRQECQQLALGIDQSTMSQPERERLFNDLLLGLVEEVAELKRCLVHKRHQLTAAAPIKSNVIDEGVDVIKYAISIMIASGISCEEFVQAFHEKSSVVDAKWRAEMVQLTESMKVFVTDLDGVVADFFGYMDKMCMERAGGTLLEIDQNKRETMVRDFYLEGGFRELSTINGAVAALRAIKRAGYKLVVVTARPYHKIRRIAADTYYWMERAGIEPDLLVWSASKSNAVWDQIHPAKVVAFVEDDTKHALDLATEGIQVLQFTSPVSEGAPEHKLIRPVNSWSEILSWLNISPMEVPDER